MNTYDDLPELGETDFDSEGVDLVVDGLGEAAFVPASLTKLSADDRQLMRSVQAQADAVRDAQDGLASLVLEARGAGVSWSAIGWCVGTTGEAARQRWGQSDG